MKKSKLVVLSSRWKSFQELKKLNCKNNLNCKSNLILKENDKNE